MTTGFSAKGYVQGFVLKGRPTQISSLVATLGKSQVKNAIDFERFSISAVLILT